MRRVQFWPIAMQTVVGWKKVLCAAILQCAETTKVPEVKRELKTTNGGKGASERDNSRGNIAPLVAPPTAMGRRGARGKKSVVS